MSSSNRIKSPSHWYYVGLLAIFALGIWFILTMGSKLSQPQHPSTAVAIATPATTQTDQSTSSSIKRFLHLDQPSALSILLLQVIVIIVTSKLFGALFHHIGQPPVMGEMFAGLALGPSILGLVSPGTMTFLFPPASMATLGTVSQVGVVLFMFVVGVELDLQHLRERASSAILVSHASIVAPFLLGTGLALFLYPILAPPTTSFTAFALFIGIAMSITAFPVLARILKDKNLSQTPLGATALACASVGDVTAWCALAFVTGVVNATGATGTIATIVLTILFALFMLFVVRRPLESIINNRIDNPSYSRRLMSGILAFVLACAWLTESIGIHALFGGFLAGVVMPSNAAVQTFLREKIEVFSSTALLPLFFVFTGLRTEITLLNDWGGWLMCGAIILVAVVGKLGGTMLMARLSHMSWRDSYGIGVLMNTRGLMELVVLNIGYDLGILSARIFVMMVIMALATTFMTAPLLSLAGIGRHSQGVEP